MSVELKGTIVELSPRFWSKGWGFCTVETEQGERVRVTGTLEGHVEGSSVKVRGSWKEDPKYGRSLAADVVLVEGLSTSIFAIQQWLHSWNQQYSYVAAHIREIAAECRWDALSDQIALHDLGVKAEDATAVAEKVRWYLAGVKARKFLIDMGFSEPESIKVAGEYGPSTEHVVKANIYQLVSDEILTFSRVDTVALENGGERMEPQRLSAAIVAALIFASRDGHTIVDEISLCNSAAEIAGVYKATLLKYLETAATSGAVKRHPRGFQLSKYSDAEELIANVLVGLACNSAEGI